MGFYFGGEYLGDTYEKAKETFLSGNYVNTNYGLIEFIAENINMTALLEWCFKQEGFVEHFSAEIEEAENQMCAWCIEKVED